MTDDRPTDEELMAFADGALAPVEAHRLARLVDGDPVLRDRVEMYRVSSDLVREARSVLDGDPVPDTLRQSIAAMIAQSESKPALPPNVVAFARKRPATASQRPWTIPLAASLVALVGGIAGYVAGHSAPQQGTASLAAVGSPLPAEITTALAQRASGTETRLANGKLRVIATVRSKSGGLCREFEVDDISGRTIVGIGCRDGSDWRLDIAVAAPQTEEGFAPVSSLNAIESYLDMIEASDPLSPEEEAAALS